MLNEKRDFPAQLGLLWNIGALENVFEVLPVSIGGTGRLRNTEVELQISLENTLG